MWPQVIREISCAIQVCRAVLQLRGDTTVIRLAEKMEIISVSNSRVWFFLSVQLCRVVIAILLWYGGTYFLVSTIDVSELMLNTVALEVCDCISSRMHAHPHIRQ